MHFRSLDFIITTKGGMEQVHIPVRPPRTTNLDPIVKAFEGLRLRTLEDRASEGSWLHNFDHERLGCQLHSFLGPRPTQEDLHQVHFLLANVRMQLSGGEPLSPKIVTGSAPMTFLFGLCNAAQDAQCLVAMHFGSFPEDNGFMGMMDYILESFHDLLAGESEAIFDSNYSGGRHHPSRECFMADPP
jgi:hypothetical protein